MIVFFLKIFSVSILVSALKKKPQKRREKILIFFLKILFWFEFFLPFHFWDDHKKKQTRKLIDEA